MIKIISLLFLLSSCASIDYSYFEDFKNVISRNEILIDQSYIDNQEFSFLKVSNSKNDAIFVLSTISKSGVYEWIGSNNERIKTKDGLIIETYGLESDIKFYYHNFLFSEGVSGINSYIDLYNPDLIYAKISLIQKSARFYLDEDSKEIEVIEYQRLCPEIGWNAKDIYIYKGNTIYKSIQQINPFMDPLKLTFYFKY